MKRFQHEKSSTRKVCNTKKVQHEKSAQKVQHKSNVTRKKVRHENSAT